MHMHANPAYTSASSHVRKLAHTFAGSRTRGTCSAIEMGRGVFLKAEQDDCKSTLPPTNEKKPRKPQQRMSFIINAEQFSLTKQKEASGWLI